MLDQLEGGNRTAELAAFHGVAPGDVEGRELLAHRLPGHGQAGDFQDLVGVAEAVGVGELEELRHHNVVERDVSVLHRAQRDLVLDFHGTVSLGLGVHEEPFDLVVVDIAGVDDHPVGESRVADPALGSIEDPVIAVAPCRGARTAGDVGAAQGFGEAEGADLLERVDLGKPRVLLLLGGKGFDGAREEPVMDAHERRDRCVGAGGLRVQNACEEVRVALPPDGADQVDFGELRDQIHGELRAIPAIDGDRPDFAGEELADFGQPVLLLGAEQLLERKEIAIGVGQVVNVDGSFGHGVPSLDQLGPKGRGLRAGNMLLISNLSQCRDACKCRPNETRQKGSRGRRRTSATAPVVADPG
ncbi:hypothetical protein SRABI128_05439 [Microbacterium sp. Bi128]|nr:hypothetical protein SRABI128_05439 [Microbacterium sp. Bi128]